MKLHLKQMKYIYMEIFVIGLVILGVINLTS